MPIGATLVHTVNAHTTDVNAVTFSPNSLASCSGDKTCRLWNLEDFSELSSSPLCGHTYSVHCCVFSPSGFLLASCSTDGRVILWDLKTGEKLCVFEHKSKSSIRVCKFSRDSCYLATGSDDETLCLWDIPARKLFKSLEGHEASVVACAFSPDGTFVVSGSSNGDLRVWDGKYGHGRHILLELDGHDLGVTGAEFSPTYGSAGIVDSTSATHLHFMLATCGNDNMVKLWDVLAQSGSTNVQLQLRDTLAGHGAPVMAICFSPNGKFLASGSGDKTVRIWDPNKGKSVHTIDGHSRYVTCCAFSVDNKLLATGSNDKLVKVWKINADELTTDETTYEDIMEKACAPSAVLLDDDSVQPHASWTVDQVSQWVAEIGMGQYVPNFKKNAIDGAELKSLNHETLQNALDISALGHRNKILRAIVNIKDHPMIQHRDSLDEGVADEFLCPITREIMKEPVIAADGYTYERAAIMSWINSGKKRSPMTNAVLGNSTLTPNRSLKMLIQRQMQQQHS